MKFDKLANWVVLNEKKQSKIKNPTQYVATGPVGYRKDTGINNVEKSETTGATLSDKGQAARSKINRVILIGLRIAISHGENIINLQKLFNKYGTLLHNIQNGKVNGRSYIEDYEKMVGNPLFHKNAIKKKFNAAQKAFNFAEENAKKAEKITPLIKNLVKSALIKSAKAIKEEAVNFTPEKKKLTSLHDLDEYFKIIDPEVKDYFKLAFEPSDFEKALDTFIKYEQNEGKDPFRYLITLYKTAMKISVDKNTFSNMHNMLEELITTTPTIKHTSSSALSHAGRQQLKQKRPDLNEVAKMLKKGEYEDAYAQAEEPDVQSAIKELIDGKRTEADVMRLIYSKK